MDGNLVAERIVSAPGDHPFDSVAERYDREFTDQVLGRWLRAAVWERLATAFEPGSNVLELGCGTGQDAVWLASRDVQVTATDASSAMLDVARQKAQAAGVAERISFAQLDLARLRPDEPGDPPFLDDERQALDCVYDGAFSNFGPLNCLADLGPLAGSLGRLVRPGGRLVLGVMGPLCPWEVAWFLAHGNLRSATRRFRAGYPARVGGQTLRVWYPSPRRLRGDFAPHFRHLETVAVGALLPPSELSHLVNRFPGFFERVNRLEDRLRNRFPLTWLNDHYVSVFERRR